MGGIAVAGLYGVRDEQVARKQIKEMLAFYSDPEFKKLMNKSGANFKYELEAYRVGDVPVATNLTELSDTGNAALAMPFMKSIYSALTTHLAVKGKLGYYTLGPQAKEVMEALLSDKLKGGLDKTKGIQQAMKTLVPGTLGWLYISPTAFARQLMKLFGSVAIKIPPTQEEGGITISMGSPGGTLNGAFDFPAAQAREIMALVGAFMGGL